MLFEVIVCIVLTYENVEGIKFLRRKVFAQKYKIRRKFFNKMTPIDSDELSWKKLPNSMKSNVIYVLGGFLVVAYILIFALFGISGEHVKKSYETVNVILYLFIYHLRYLNY
jgi:hypothetical protein